MDPKPWTFNDETGVWLAGAGGLFGPVAHGKNSFGRSFSRRARKDTMVNKLGVQTENNIRL